jgi:hypothetical protein
MIQSFRNVCIKQETLPMSASVPPLGLSNKATNDSEHQRSNQVFTAIVHH